MRRCFLLLFLWTAPLCAQGSPKGFPVIEVKAVEPQKNIFAVIISGDGGWVTIDRHLAKTMSEAGVPVVGVDSLKYFWHKKTPEVMSFDLARVMRQYLDAWKKEKVILVGYSRGADALPFMISRLPADLREKVRTVALLGVEKSSDFKIGAGDILNIKSKDEIPIRPEVDKLKGMNIICFYGEEETESLCPELPAGFAEAVRMKGGHHFGGAYEEMAKKILNK